MGPPAGGDLTLVTAGPLGPPRGLAPPRPAPRRKRKEGAELAQVSLCQPGRSHSSLTPPPGGDRARRPEVRLRQKPLHTEHEAEGGTSRLSTQPERGPFRGPLSPRWERRPSHHGHEALAVTRPLRSQGLRSHQQHRPGRCYPNRKNLGLQGRDLWDRSCGNGKEAVRKGGGQTPWWHQPHSSLQPEKRTTQKN